MITWRPARPVVGRIALGTLDGPGNFARVYINGEKVFEGEVANRSVRWTPETGGRHEVRIDWFNRGAELGGGWESSGWGLLETLVSVETVVVSVGERLRHRFGWGDNTGWLVLYVWDDLVQPTTMLEHGEVTPAFEGLTSKIAEVAAERCVPWVDGLLTYPIDGDPERVLGYTIDMVQGERLDTHPNPSTLPRFAGMLFREMELHATDTSTHDNDTGLTTQQVIHKNTKVPAGTFWTHMAPEDVAWFQTAWQLHSMSTGLDGLGTGLYHTGSDPLAVLQAPLASDMASALVALGELVVCVDAHDLNVAIHKYESAPVFPPTGSAHFLNGGTTVWGLNMRGCMRMHYEWAKVLRSQAVQVIGSVNTGASTLSSLGGFTT